MKSITDKKWRRINRYTCQGCGKRRYSFVYRRAFAGLCTKCARAVLPEQQTSLFDGEKSKPSA